MEELRTRINTGHIVKSYRNRTVIMAEQTNTHGGNHLNLSELNS